MKSALTLRKSRTGTAGGSMRVGQLGSGRSTKHLSLKNVGALKSLKAGASESLLLLGDAEFAVNQGERKAARLHNYKFFDDAEELEVVQLQSAVEVKTQKLPGSGGSKRSTFRASLLKAKRDQGDLAIGDGRLQFNFKSGKALKFEVAQIETVMLKSMKSKDFGIRFINDERAFVVKCENNIIAQNWVRAIFLEARQQTLVLSKILQRILPEDWNQALQTSSKMKDSPDAKMLTVMEKKEKDATEICLREMVDLVAFARGHDNMEYFEICEKFSKWLIKNGKGKEAEYWVELVKKGVCTHQEKLKKELNGDGTFLGQKLDERQNAIEAIRNPVRLSDIAEMRKQSTPENLASRVSRMEANLTKIVETMGESGDHYETLI